MALIDEVKKICNRLVAGDPSWRDLLLHYSIDITNEDLATELNKNIQLQTPDGTPIGFEDFASSQAQGIKPGEPAKSLLFHALASPHVTKNLQGQDLQEFPTLEEIDIVENYVYSQKKESLSNLKNNFTNLSVVVFASEYRNWNDTTHKKHADICYSRTGVSRVGTVESKYVAKDRGFTPLVSENKNAIRVCPARFSAYLAIEMTGNEDESRPMRFWSNPSLEEMRTLSGRPWAIPQQSDDQQRFWIPIHKLFEGSECLIDTQVNISLKSFHVNEKIRKIHQTLTNRSNQLKPDSETLNYPYKFTNDIAEFSNESITKFGPGVLIPVVHEHLVEEAKVGNELVSFKVPRNNIVNGNTRYRFSSSLEINQSGPEYVHVRSKVLPDGSTQNLNEQQAGETRNIEQIVEEGNYDALHYVDYSADGYITAEISGSLELENLKSVSAYSLVAAPDFFPFCNQRELMEWWTDLPSTILKQTTWELPPLVLSDSRFRPNLTLGQGAFDEEDVTCTSIVSLSFSYEDIDNKPEIVTHRHSCMPDNAAGVFAPGWDVGTDNIEFPENSDEELFVTVGYRLGSPFPEDAKLCAALSTFWPAVAPDVSRTFGPTFFNQRNVCPLTDREIGIEGDLPWDGVKGPINTGNKVEYTLFEYADYTINALHDQFSVHELSKVGFKEYTNRIIAMAKVRRYSELIRMEFSGNPYSVISFKSNFDVQDELATASSNFTNSMNSPYRFRVCTYSDIATPTINHDKSTFTIENNYTIFADGDLQSNQIWIKKGQGGDWTSGSWDSEQITL